MIEAPTSPIVSANFLLTSFSGSFYKATIIFSLNNYLVAGYSFFHIFV